MALEVLREVTASEYKGPRAIFSEVHVLKALMTLGASGAVGRGKLGGLLGLGQGEVRTLIRRLKENGLILIQADGCKLSKKGEKEYQGLREKIPWSAKVEARSLGLGEDSAGVIVRTASGGVKKGIEQRDAAVRVGANGALTAVFKGGRFALPGEAGDLESRGPRDLWKAARGAAPKEGDVLIVVGASSEEAAGLGALAAALTLL